MRFLATTETADGETQQKTVEVAGTPSDNWAVWITRSFRTNPDLVRITASAFVPPAPDCPPRIEIMRAEWEMADSCCSCCGARTPWATDRGYAAFLKDYEENPDRYPFVLGRSKHKRR